MHTDSPGIPASATAHELFRGFSFVAPVLLDELNSKMDLSMEQSGTCNNGNSQATPGARNVKAPVALDSNRVISRCKGRSLSEYEFFEVLGKGSFSICKRCLHTETKQQYAVKVCRTLIPTYSKYVLMFFICEPKPDN